MIIQLSALPSDAGHCPHAPCRNTEVSELNQVAPRCVLSVAESGLTLTNYMYAISREANHGARYGFTLCFLSLGESLELERRGDSLVRARASWVVGAQCTEEVAAIKRSEAGVVYYFGRQGSDYSIVCLVHGLVTFRCSTTVTMPNHLH